jgi:hypothetical protein
VQKEISLKTCKKVHIFGGKSGKKSWFSSENGFANPTAKMPGVTAMTYRGFVRKAKEMKAILSPGLTAWADRNGPSDTLHAGRIETNH